MQPINERSNTMSSKPSHRTFVVTQAKEGSDQKGFWHEVGVVWPHKSGKGFDVVIPEGISVSGRIVCTEPKDKPASE
jgi:type IV secretory pathway TraG/TraD family ATPase VirD4